MSNGVAVLSMGAQRKTATGKTSGPGGSGRADAHRPTQVQKQRRVAITQRFKGTTPPGKKTYPKLG